MSIIPLFCEIDDFFLKAVFCDVFKQPSDGENVAVGTLRVPPGSTVLGIWKMGIVKHFHNLLNDAGDRYERAWDIFQLQRMGF